MSNSPGPWNLNQNGVDYNAEWWSVWASDGQFVCGFVQMTEEAMPSTLANARLIVAAPELLAACEAALNDRMYKDWPQIADLLKAAIAKARG